MSFDLLCFKIFSRFSVTVFLFYRLKDIFDSDECVNDTYHRARLSIPPTRPTRLGAFLAKITRNLAPDRYNKRNAAKRGGEHEEDKEKIRIIKG